MYTAIKNVQILIALLKKKGVRIVVHSPGGCDLAIGHSLENDPFFTCYSVVDERSAVFFAMGLSMSKNEPVALVCTSGTAVSNYSSGLAEAYYKGVPLVAITADRHPYLLNQLETQKINQERIFQDVTKCEVTLPVASNSTDEWYCERVINEAFLAMDHGTPGPVHINVPVVGSSAGFAVENLPEVTLVERVTCESDSELWKEKVEELFSCKKILVVLGENDRFSEQNLASIEQFALRTGCVVSVEHMSSYKGEHSLFTYRATEAMTLSSFEKLMPDLVISACGNIASVNMKSHLRALRKRYKHWSIRPDGLICDVFKNVSTVFECSPMHFFEYFASALSSREMSSNDYYEQWKTAIDNVKMPEFGFSNFYIAQQLAKSIPDNSLLELGILNSTRTMQFFDLDRTIEVSSNLGALGIDGSLSTAIGRAAGSNKECFVVLGDLSFFYDMNSLNIQHLSNRLHILVVNNNGACEFHIGNPRSTMPNIDSLIAAGHSSSVEGWVRSRGMRYLSARTKEEFCKALKVFVGESESPIVLEAFTDREADAAYLDDFYDLNSGASAKERAVKAAKKAAKGSVFGKNVLGIASKVMNQ
ncbi:2-succinyl-5-enolpyruvyl-6-hydroxy-3-cyclohexene-1-carboxylic-acid synthase [Paraeggerthella hongkongensis]|uniref:2-succinyl-5-enolpyruvyl-6-hydroxy-3- cyclohexene-1-carboxylic-acid synthase n=1 Tax=Paraeggerthella hominis TaxID=2897351 RepID=UPI001C120378|nr:MULTISPECIES: 2-succinyl-5-enolpyruvyl-6-hydroxy-3-cyclohexene-1-carboxylic-acid synthase [Paraeggerthella]MBU5405334.1 2-succinyl-5-enolpyruvyl-6-hydroxy-3-cyclohexene-1-carboxylic-acid synthase [Paraeggerthella hongkongensis]MCD2433296.1 2-succinyl-5-enolpyruvyl-6-hydroxy-3-cyclohexene-1-carboxylic-acid synthase [Paraeggerthella hominis]